ncbi:MAG: PIG-L family deacetylase [Deltaproteobacteria bacterium]|uniref:PIG-L family deacetylase n=1 Tax=Candidatus Zymogenus saltonus TaxID=2844893 RepID=A0A9D8KDP9_9DELT|nr:PIG-L family deacetylase [Candidatus Zymogenus saltonus]
MRVLVICAHPDEETLGVGGTLLKHRSQRDELYWIIVTRAHQPKWSEKVIEEKDAEIERVAEAYGIKKYFPLKFPAALLDGVPFDEIIKKIDDVVAAVKPDVVYVVNGGDIHTDHHAVFRAVLSVLKPFRLKDLGVKRVLTFESLSSTEASPHVIAGAFSPTVFIDITGYIDKKIEIMEYYKTESQEDPLPRGPGAIRALARFRGATIGVDYAEAFMLLYTIG